VLFRKRNISAVHMAKVRATGGEEKTAGQKGVLQVNQSGISGATKPMKERREEVGVFEKRKKTRAKQYKKEGGPYT